MGEAGPTLRVGGKLLGRGRVGLGLGVFGDTCISLLTCVVAQICLGYLCGEQVGTNLCQQHRCGIWHAVGHTGTHKLTHTLTESVSPQRVHCHPPF